MNPPESDTQRELEQRALRNVRGLVDKIETSDELDRRAQKRAFTFIVAAAVAVFVGVVAYFALRETFAEKKPAVVVDPAKLPPVRPGPQTR